MRDSKSITTVLILGISILIAGWLGVSVVTNQTETLLKVAGAGLLFVCILLGRRIWLLMMFFVALNVPVIRGFTTMEMGYGLFVAFTILLISVRRIPLKLSFGEPEIWSLIIVASVLQAYFRNPVGLGLFGAGSVGGRPYFTFAVSFVAAVFLSALLVPTKELRWASYLSILGGFVGIPLTEMRVASGYASMGVVQETSRLPWLNHTAEKLSRWLVSAMSPYKALIRPLALLALLFCVGAAAGSGYRNAVAAVGLLFLAGVYYHNGFFAMVASTVAAAACVAILAIVNIVAPLPQQMQRALSPFPGTWEERYKRDAESSTEWRIAMWKEALFTEHWIKNKVLGDGLGMSRDQLNRMQSLTALGQDAWFNSSGLTNQQETMLLSGAYHSGPVQTVRTVGYVGLVLLLCAMIRLAVLSHRMIKRFHHTEWAFITKYFGIPLVVLPFFFTIIFGDFGRDAGVVLIGFAMLRLLGNNLPQPAPAAVHLPALGRTVDILRREAAV